MILFNDATSPFGRKVMIAAIERGIPLIEEFIDLAAAEHLDRYNPLRQIPVLVTDSGEGIYDSDTILHYLDVLDLAPPLIPRERAIEILTRCALANGLMEATLTRLLETRRPREQQSQAFIDLREARIARVVSALERDSTCFVEMPITADQITVATALGYLDFRYSHAWRASAPALAAWYEVMAARPSFVETVPERKAPANTPKATSDRA